ncbi:MAG: dienelactone hydrolase [Kiritimatiellia bacterium]|nr:dienelactone hydrolase [Kiritimatiellia bacterium]
MNRVFRFFPWTPLAALFLILPVLAAKPGYDPLRVDSSFEPTIVDFTIRDAERDRDIPVRVYLPAATNAPVLLFSHGLGGSRENGAYLGRHWAAQGYVALFLQHLGSDESIWKNVPAEKRRKSIREAMSGKNLKLRAQDVTATLNQLAIWNSEEGHALGGRLDLNRVGMSGHSFGALTTQAVSGQVFPLGLLKSTDPRIRAAIAFSPSSPRVGRTKKAFGEVAIPWLLMTGTKDVAQVGNIDLESRLAVFPALPPGHKYELVLDGAEHSAFGERSLPGESGGRNPNHHRAILALSTAFWDAFLRGNPAAQAWLDGEGARSVLEPKDRWQMK